MVLGLQGEKQGSGLGEGGQGVGSVELLGEGEGLSPGGLALLTPLVTPQSKGERMRAWIRTRLPACCQERDSWSAYIFPPQSR